MSKFCEKHQHSYLNVCSDCIKETMNKVFGKPEGKKQQLYMRVSVEHICHRCGSKSISNFPINELNEFLAGSFLQLNGYTESPELLECYELTPNCNNCTGD